MVLSHRHPLMSGAFIFVTCLFSSTSVTHAAAPVDTARITAVANVTLRALPSPTATAVAQLPLGTEVADAGPAGLDKTWVHVKLADAREGWLQASLTRSLDPVWRWPVFDRIISDRLGRKGDGFPANVELVSFIERVAAEYTDTDGRARVELARLRALSQTTAAIPFNHAKREPYATWLTARKNDVVYDEPGGRWMVRDTTIWDVHQKYATTALADDIAWLATTNGLWGECEGDVSCYLYVQNRLQGEYLRRHPGGRHASDAIDVIIKAIDSFAPAGTLLPSYTLEKKSECGDLIKAVDGLSSAIQGTRVAGRDAALTKLAGVKKICG